MPKILFVCLGNICRSPAAQAVFESVLSKNDVSYQDWVVDSAGTSSCHSGARADPRMRKAARSRGLELTSISRNFCTPSDFQNFDYIVVMDQKNYQDLIALDPKMKYAMKLHLMSDFFRSFQHKDVPDPYFGGEEGFDLVLDMIEEGCQNLFKKIKQGS